MRSDAQLLGNRYELRGVLGRGGMAEVREGWDTRLSRPVAIKLLYPGWAADDDLRRRFEDEARAAAALNHPNVVAVHDSGDHRGTPFIVMERLSGRTLADDIATGPLPPARVATVLDQVLSALSAAHAAGVLHRDIKPGNILIGAVGQAKLSDFGIAKTGGAAHTRTGQVIGTMAYLSPQRLAGQPAGVSDDLYAVGVVGYEALTGRRPFADENPAAMVRAILDQPLVPLAELRPDVDPALAAAVETAMARDPAYRYPDAATMRAVLTGEAPPTQRFTTARPATKMLTAPMPAQYPPLPPPRRRRSRARLVAGIAAAVAAVVLGVILMVAERPPQSPPRPATTSVPVVPSSSLPPLPPTSSVAPAEEQGPGPPGPGKGHGKNKERPNKKGNPHE